MDQNGHFAAGVDTHKDTHALCVIDGVGRVVRTGTYAADSAGYDEIAAAIGDPDDCIVVGIEGTGSYGAGLSRRLVELGFNVVEVVRPKRDKRMVGTDKNDPADAERAAREALSGKCKARPKGGDGWVEAIRYRMAAREAAVRASTSAANTVHALMITAPAPIREKFSGLNTPNLMRALSRKRKSRSDIEQSLWDSLRALALSWVAANKSAEEQKDAIKDLITANAPALISMYCCGPISAAQLLVAVGDNPERMDSESSFASLCGASPIEASSGKVKRHRLNRGGNRQANRALHTIARLRMKKDGRTRNYVDKRTKGGKSRREIERCLVRYIAREAYRALTHPLEVSRYAQCDFAEALRSKRVSAGLTQAAAAAALGVASARISEIERAVIIDEEMLVRYRDWLNDAILEKSSNLRENTLDGI